MSCVCVCPADVGWGGGGGDGACCLKPAAPMGLWPLPLGLSLSPLPPPPIAPPGVTFRRVVVSLRGPGQSPVLPFACCVGLLSSVGRCGRCSCWCCFRVRGAQWLVCRGCAGRGRCCLCVSGAQWLACCALPLVISPSLGLAYPHPPTPPSFPSGGCANGAAPDCPCPTAPCRAHTEEGTGPCPLALWEEEEEEEDLCTVIGRPLCRRPVMQRTPDSSSALHLSHTL